MKKEQIKELLKKYERLALKWKKFLKEKHLKENEEYIRGVIYAFEKIIYDLENLL